MPVKRVGVIGSGIMGSGIAEVLIGSGFEVLLRSRSERDGEACAGRLSESLARKVEKGKLSGDERDAALSRLRVVADLRELELCELIIESVVEDLQTKRDLFAALDRVCGMHFFNPAPAMPLVEIVPALTTSEETIAIVRGVAVGCGKDPVMAADRAGFIVNALLFPYLNAAVRMLDRGVATRGDIDAAMRGGCGFPMGPLELLDLVGLDTSLAILEVLHAENGDAGSLAAPLLRRMVAAGQLGRKTGQGFYPHPATTRRS